MSARPWRGALAEATDLAYEDWEDSEREDSLNANLDVCGGVFRPGGDNPGIYQCDKCGAVAVRLRPSP